MQKKSNNKNTERNWVKEYNQASWWDKHMMEYQQRHHAQEVDRMEAAAQEREERKAKAMARQEYAYQQLSPEEQANYRRIHEKRATRRKIIFAVIVIPFMVYMYATNGIGGVLVGAIGVLFALRVLAVLMS